MAEGGISSLSNAEGALPIAAVSSTSSLDSWFTQMAGGDNTATVSSEPTQRDTGQLKPSHEPSHESHTPQSDNTSVISPAMNQLLQAPLAGALPHMMLPPNQIPMYPTRASAAVALAGTGTAGGNSIPEFLYQLTKMLTDDNREIIEWSKGKIEVHSPHKLETHVLEKYFRHSKFASFQRQLNYFGFRKLAGKGKMAPCSYMNDAATGDLGSLLLIKRKTSTTTAPKEKKEGKKRSGEAPSTKRPPTKTARLPETIKSETNINPVLAGILYRSKSPAETANATASAAAAARKPVASQLPNATGVHQALARTAVGRGIRHSYSLGGGSHPGSQPARPMQVQSMHTASAPQGNANASLHPGAPPFDFPELPNANDSLSQLTSNYQNSLNDMSTSLNETQSLDDETMPTPLDQMRDGNAAGAFGGFLSRDSSLVDLAMIPNVDDTDDQQTDFRSFGMNFVDFPNPEVYPTSGNEGSCNGGESE